MLLFIIPMTIFLSLAFGHLSRMCGGGPPKLPLGLDQWFYAIPYGLVALLALSGAPTWVLILLPLLAYFGAFLGKRTGHGQYLDLGTWERLVSPERLDFIVTWLVGTDDNTVTDGVKGNAFRDFVGLTVTGLVVGLITSLIVIFTGHILLGLGILLGASLKGLAYVIGWKFNGYKYIEHLDEPTELGEFLTGFFGGLPVFLTILLLLLG